MTSWWHYFLVAVFVIFTLADDGIFDTASGTPQAQGARPQGLVSSSEGTCAPGTSTSTSNLGDATITSLPRQEFSSPSTTRDGASPRCDKGLVLRNVPEDEISLFVESWENWDTEYQEWDGYASTDSRGRTNSPRQRTAPATNNQRTPMPSRQNKGEGKGKSGKTSYKGKFHIDPPPWAQSTPAPPSTSSPSTVPTPAQSKAEAKLQEIVSVMHKKKDSLDPELNTLAQEAAMLQSQSATSKLMSAVSKHGDAKTSLLDARTARANLHSTWKQYLDAAVITWRGFIEDYANEDKRLEEAVKAAEEHLLAAQTNLDDAKLVATEQELKEQVEMIEDDEEAVDSTSKSGNAIREGLANMMAGLEKLQEKTDEATGEVTKRQRLGDGSSKTSSTVSALEPFARAGHQTK
eukprot:s1029_g4.t1